MGQPRTVPLRPGTAGLRAGADHETVTIPNTMMGFVEGRSSWARMGINVQAAPKIDPGFSGTITLEIANFGRANIRLVAEKHEPAQLLLAYLNTPIPLV